jgi:phage-related minor tail protein
MAKGAKTGGRKPGTPNKATVEFRQTVQSLLDDNRDNVKTWLSQVAEGHGDTKADPAKALDLLAKLAEYAAPKLNRTEHTGEGGGPVQQSVKVIFE